MYVEIKAMRELAKKEIYCILSRALQNPLVHFFILALLFVALVLHWNNSDIIFDDAYISFRYARNLARGQGLVYNPGEKVEGYTNFLWTLMLAGCICLGIDVIVASKILATLAGLCILATLNVFARKLLAPDKFAPLLWVTPSLLFVVTNSQPRYAVSGMETLMFTWLVCLSVYLFYRSSGEMTSKEVFQRISIGSSCKILNDTRGSRIRWVIPLTFVGALFAITTMIRPEGVIYFTTVCSFLVIEQICKRRLTMKGLVSLMGGFFAIYLPYLAWRYIYYGNLLPNTYYAKAVPFGLWRIQRGLSILRVVVAQWNLWPLLCISILAFLPSRNSFFYLMQTLIVITFLYFIWIGGDFIVWFGPRFLMPIFPFVLLMATEGLRKMWSLFPSAKWKGGLVRFAFLSLLALGQYFLAWPALYFGRDAFAVQMHGWAELGYWIAKNTPPDAVIATDAAGIIPYYSDRIAIDMFGITDEHIGHLKTVGKITAGHDKIDPRYILARKPDYIVSTWLDMEGNAVSAGLGMFRQKMEAMYKLIAIAKVRNGAPQDGRWIIVTSEYTPALYQQGYVCGLFQRIAND